MLPGALTGAGVGLQVAGVPTMTQTQPVQGDLNSGLGYGGEQSDAYTGSVPPNDFSQLKPWERITNMRLGVRLQNQELQGKFQSTWTLPQITEHLAKTQARQAADLETIERAKLALSAPPPDEPTYPVTNIGEGLAGGLAALMSGGGIGASNAINSTQKVAMDRQIREFQNGMRKYQVQRENAGRDLNFAQADQLNAQELADALEREKRGAMIDRDKTGLDQALKALGIDTQLGLAAEAAYGSDYENRQKMANQKDLIEFNAAIDRRTDELRRSADEASKIKLDDIQRLRDLVEKGTPDQVHAAVADLVRVHHIPFSGQSVAAAVDAANLRQAMMEREMKAREDAVQFRDPALKAGAPLPPGTQLEIAKMQQDGYTVPPGLTGQIGLLPLPQGSPTGGPSAPSPAATGQAFNLHGQSLTAKAGLDSVRGAHRALIGQNPYPAVTTQKDADANLSIAQRKEWAKWNSTVQASARALAAAKAKYVTLLPRPAKQVMSQAAREILDRIKTLGKGASNAVNADQFREMQRKLRESFEDTYGVDVDTALRAAKK